jgi:hypothetical protein
MNHQRARFNGRDALAVRDLEHVGRDARSGEVAHAQHAQGSVAILRPGEFGVGKASG